MVQTAQTKGRSADIHYAEINKGYSNDSVICFFRRESELEVTLRVCAVTVQNVNTSKNKRNKLASAGKTACKNT